MVEFAVTAPVLVMTLTGTCSCALAFYSLQQLANATSNAVQTVAAYQGLNTGTINDSDPCALAASTVTGTLSGWNAGSFSYSMVITDSNGDTHPYSSTTSGGTTTFTCTAGSAELAQNEPVTLTVTYSYSWLPILSFTPKSPLTSAQGTLAQ